MAKLGDVQIVLLEALFLETASRALVTGLQLRQIFRELEEAVAVSGVCSGVPEENSGKIAGKIYPESQNAANSRILGTGKGKPAGKLGSTLPGPCPHLRCRVFFGIDSSSLVEIFFF